MATLEQIAREAGVSRGTVTNVLKGRNKEAWTGTARRAEEIRAIAKRLGYRPNAAAVATATGKFGGFGLVAGEGHQHTFLPSGLLWGINDALESAGLHLSIAFLSREESQKRLLPKMLCELMVDGLLVNGTNETVTRTLLQDGPPATRIPCPLIAMNWQRAGDCVFPDDFEATLRATQHLLELGHTRIAYVGLAMPEPHHPSVEARSCGYETAMRRADRTPRFIHLPVDALRWPNRQSAMALEPARAVLQEAKRPTALVFYETSEVVLPFFTAALQLGLDVPRDLSLLSISNNCEFPLLSGLDLSVLEVPFFEVGRRSVEALIEKICCSALVLPPQKVPYGALAGNTCAPPRLLSRAARS